jgi:hypothetical protein
MTLDFSIQEKRVIYNILAQIMKADTIINPAEVRFLDEVFYNFNLSLDEFDHMEEVDFDELSLAFSNFSEEKKEYARQMFVEMSECDGYVDPREKSLIEKLV